MWEENQSTFLWNIEEQGLLKWWVDGVAQVLMASDGWVFNQDGQILLFDIKQYYSTF